MEKQKLTEAELLQLATWNATRQDYPLNICIPELIAAQAAATPTAIAVVIDDAVLSYQELNTRANQLAHHLQELGVQPDMFVGCCIHRSIDLVVALLGTLKAGAAYIPLDPDYPSERLTFMLEDAQMHTLVTLEKFVAHLGMGKNRIVCLDSDSVHLAQQSTTNPVSSATADNLAYVIYTSGSTGQPKGVQVSHRSLLNLVFWHQRAFEVTASDRATQLTSPAFDATGWEIWPYLTAGASIYIPDENTRATPLALHHSLLNNNITISFVPTALAESLMTLEWPTTTSLRYLLTGADALHRYPSPSLPFALINNYGPTETTVVATSGRIPPTPKTEGAPTIGRPIDNTQIYILDEHLQRVPIGTPGELYIGGAGLARGYLNRPELTAERFISHPFSQEPQARLYKTGDRARFLADGQIAYMGRTDHQIKIRGYRIEPGEVIAALNNDPTIQTSIVVAREETPGDNRLVAYIVKVPGAEVTASSLQNKLQQQLPDYMLPATFVLLDALPLTVNGKIDRAALPIPDEINTLRDGIIVAPTTITERRLVEIVAPLLGLAQIGIDDNFFLLGGHSLLGTQVITRIAEAFGVNLLLHSLFEAPTIRQLASEIERLVLIKIETMNVEEILHLLKQG